MISEYDFLLGSKSKSKDIALVDNTRQYTYEKLCREVISLSLELEAVGICLGDRVAVILPNSADYIISYFSNNHIGAINVPIDYNSKNKTIIHVIDDCKINCIITDEIKYNEIYKILENKDTNLVVFQKDTDKRIVKSKNSHLKLKSVSKNIGKVSLVVYTTGTTGKKKGVMLNNDNVLRAAGAINNVMRIPQSPVELIAMPLSRSFGLARMRCVFMKNGTIVLTDGLLNPAIFIQKLFDYKIIGFGSVPAGIRLLISKFAKYLNQLSSQIKYIELGSAPFSKSEKENLQKIMPFTDIFMHFGLTEASRATFINFKEKNALNSVGRPTPGTRIKICDDNLQDLGCNKEGKILIDSKWLTEGYWGLDNGKYFDDGWLITDDIGMIDSKGLLHFISRESDVINFQGYKFSPLEIENVLNAHEEIHASCVILREEPKPEIIAFLECDKKDISLIQELKDMCSSVLENYKIPSEFIFVKKVDRSDTGKIIRRTMRKKYAG